MFIVHDPLGSPLEKLLSSKGEIHIFPNQKLRAELKMLEIKSKENKQIKNITCDIENSPNVYSTL